jgi:hypothetical protein
MIRERVRSIAHMMGAGEVELAQAETNDLLKQYPMHHMDISLAITNTYLDLLTRTPPDHHLDDTGE